MKSKLVTAEFLQETEEIQLCAVDLAHALRCMVVADARMMATREAALAKWDALMERLRDALMERLHKGT